METSIKKLRLLRGEKKSEKINFCAKSVIHLYKSLGLPPHLHFELCDFHLLDSFSNKGLPLAVGLIKFKLLCLTVVWGVQVTDPNYVPRYWGLCPLSLYGDLSVRKSKDLRR